jgi:cytochrome c peroxidase
MNDMDGAVDPRINLVRFGGTVPDRDRKGRGGFTGVVEEEYAFKVPQLYNLEDSRFYGHGSSFASVRDVVVYFIFAQPQNPGVPVERLSPNFRPRPVVGDEIDDLVAFVSDALYDPNLIRYEPATTPTGLCFPANDPQSQVDLGCSPSATRPPTRWEKPSD